jgi:hypothetical protein
VVNAPAVPQLHVVHMAQPVVGQAHARAAQGGQHTTAAVMPHHHDVLHLEVIHRKLDDRQRVQVRVHHHIGHIAMHKHLARIQPRDFIGRHAAVRTANPEVLGRLLVRQLGEKTRALQLHAGSPVAVVVEQVLEAIGHGSDCPPRE